MLRINRSPEPTDGGYEQDPMTLASSNLKEPKFPCIAPDRVLSFKIVKSSVQDVKDKPGRKSLVLQMKTEEDTVDTDGLPLRTGFTVYNRFSITPTDGTDGKRPRTQKQIAEELGKLLRGCGIKDKQPAELVGYKDIPGDPAMLEGRLCAFRVGMGKPTPEFPDPSNTFRVEIPA